VRVLLASRTVLAYRGSPWYLASLMKAGDGNHVGAIGGGRVVILEAEAEAAENLKFITRSCGYEQ